MKICTFESSFEEINRIDDIFPEMVVHMSGQDVTDTWTV